ncbi:unnamed protein product, partial [Adineta steineri]
MEINDQNLEALATYL